MRFMSCPCPFPRSLGPASFSRHRAGREGSAWTGQLRGRGRGVGNALLGSGGREDWGMNLNVYDWFLALLGPGIEA